ncbi:MAG: hypothetical protein LBN95_01330 [Prevotellaceae bacterium]|jgi:hypothetical protein|nr:hypothetical protein [Prevotellaceae bacterium]
MAKEIFIKIFCENKLTRYICFFIFLFINTLFSVKYFSRYTDFYIPATVLIDVMLVAIFAIKTDKIDAKIFSIFNYILLIVYLIFCIIIFQIIDINSLHVDRWSVISSFWQNFENGEYVYFAKSNEGNYPGPMPFYYILAYPFYFVKELGYFSMLGVPLFFLLLKYCKIEEGTQTKLLLLLLFSSFLWWEIMCRSNILLNSTLILFSIVYFFKEFPKFTTKKLIFSGILFGLLLSTRNVFAIAYIISCIFALKIRYVSFKQMFILAGIALCTFVGTFIPFVYGFWNEFLQMNPFIIQGSALMPFSYTLIFIVLAIIFGFICKKPTDVFFYIALDLFLCIFTYSIYHICGNRLNEAFFGNIVDISYFILCIPFALFFYYKKIKECF